MGKERNAWTREEDNLLRTNVEIYGAKHWKFVANAFQNRLPAQCAHRWNKVLNPTIKKGMWTSEEDETLLVAIHKCGGPGQWSLMSEYVPGRNGKQCRERYHNHLSPEVNKTPWTAGEDEIVLSLQQQIGSKWAEISRHLNGRTENSIKNRWNAKLIHLARVNFAHLANPATPTKFRRVKQRSNVRKHKLGATKQERRARSSVKRGRTPSPQISSATAADALTINNKDNNTSAAKRSKFDLSSRLGLLLRCDAALTAPQQTRPSPVSTSLLPTATPQLSPDMGKLLLPGSTTTMQAPVPIKPFLLEYQKLSGIPCTLLSRQLWSAIGTLSGDVNQNVNGVQLGPKMSPQLTSPSTMLLSAATTGGGTGNGGANKLEWFAALATSMPNGITHSQPSPAGALVTLTPQAKTKWEAPRMV